MDKLKEILMEEIKQRRRDRIIKELLKQERKKWLEAYQCI